MRKLFLILFGLVAFLPSAHAVNVFQPLRDYLTVGNRVLTDLTNLKVLVAETSTNGFATFRLNDGTGTAYQVASGKTFSCVGVKVNPIAAAANTYFSIGYGDTDVGQNAAAAPTTPKYAGNDATAAVIMLTPSQAQTPPSTDLEFNVPALKYPFVNMAAGFHGSVWLYGYEN